MSHETALKLCLVYAPEDERLYLVLEKRLKLLEQQHVIEFWSARQIPVGSSQAQVLEAQLAAADLIVYLFSMDLMASEYYADLSVGSVMERYKRGAVQIIPVILQPIPVELLSPPFTDLQLLPKGGRPVSNWRNRNLALVNIVLEIKQMAERMAKRPGRRLSAGAEEPSVTASDMPGLHVPYSRNLLFTGRESLLDAVYEHLHAQDTQPGLLALTGLGGVGKTQLALEYAYRHQHEYQAVFWIRADTPENLTSDGLTLAQTLQLPEKDSPEHERVLAALKRWLQQHANWLLVLDNVADLEMAAHFLPAQHQGHVLITTRMQATNALAPSLGVSPVEAEEGARLLLHRALGLHANVENDVVHYQQAQEVARLLGGLPLALDQAGAYIEETGNGLDTYLQLYQQRRADLLKRRGRSARDHPASVSATFALAFEQVEQMCPPAADLLRLCAFLHPATIPETLLLANSASANQTLLPGIADHYELDVALEVLLLFSLVQRNPVIHALSIHRLVQDVLKDALTVQEQRSWAERVVLLVKQAWPGTGVAHWGRCQEYLPHTLVCAELIARWELRSEEATHLLSKAGMYLSMRASYPEAERLLLQALTLGETFMGREHSQTASILYELGWLAHCLHRYSQAEEYYQRALTIRTNHPGPDSLLSAQIVQKLGLLRLNQREYTEAEMFLQRALAICEQQPGTDHPLLADSLNALAMLCRARQQYGEAEALYQRALALREQHLGPDDPETATSISNLAVLYFAQGKYAEAEPLYLRVLTIRERTLGLEHPGVALALGGLALVYYFQKQYHKAEPLARRALAIQEITPGREHPETAQSLMTLAMLAFRQGDYRQAEALAVEALAIRERVLHPQAPDLITSLNNLALIYREQKKYDLALPLYQRALTLSEQEHGKEHTYTLRIRSNLAKLAQQIELPAEGSTG